LQLLATSKNLLPIKDISKILNFPRYVVSYSLRRLSENDLIEVYSSGTYTTYSLSDKGREIYKILFE
jgi:Mn-dependent DtxR family transcriptional regulator